MSTSVLFHPDLLKDQVALITGGRSGIGYTVAQLFLSLGAQVIIASRDKARLEQAKDDLAIHGGDILAFPCDIRESEQIKSLADFIAERCQRLDILINNAGGQFPTLSEKLNDKGWEAVIHNNLNGTFYITREMANRFFIPQQAGSIVNVIANIARGFPGMVHTGAARAGVENLSKTLAQEWACHNIRINCVAPGIIATSGLKTYPKAVQDLLEKAASSVPFKRFGESEEVANTVCFLASQLASYTSGSTLYVDGAQHLNFNNLGLVNAIKMMTKS